MSHYTFYGKVFSGGVGVLTVTGVCTFLTLRKIFDNFLPTVCRCDLFASWFVFATWSRKEIFADGLLVSFEMFFEWCCAIFCRRWLAAWFVVLLSFFFRRVSRR